MPVSARSTSWATHRFNPREKPHVPSHTRDTLVAGSLSAAARQRPPVTHQNQVVWQNEVGRRQAKRMHNDSLFVHNSAKRDGHDTSTNSTTYPQSRRDCDRCCSCTVLSLAALTRSTAFLTHPTIPCLFLPTVEGRYTCHEMVKGVFVGILSKPTPTTLNIFTHPPIVVDPLSSTLAPAHDPPPFHMRSMGNCGKEATIDQPERRPKR